MLPIREWRLDLLDFCPSSPWRHVLHQFQKWQYRWYKRTAFIPSNIASWNDSWTSNQTCSNVGTYASIEIWTHHHIKLLRFRYHLLKMIARWWQTCMAVLSTIISSNVKFVDAYSFCDTSRKIFKNSPSVTFLFHDGAQEYMMLAL